MSSLTVEEKRICEFVRVLSSSIEEDLADEDILKRTFGLANKFGITIFSKKEYTGTIKFYNYHQGYGFIIPDEPLKELGMCDVYLRSNVLAASKIVTLWKNARVIFSYRIDRELNKPYAVRIRLPRKDEIEKMGSAPPPSNGQEDYDDND